MNAAVHFASVGGGPLEISGDTLALAVQSHFRRLASRMEIGNAAGYHLHRVAVKIEEGHWITKDGTTIIGDRPGDAIGKRGTLVVEWTGMDLAHQAASKTISRTTAPMVVPFDADSCEIPIS